MKKALIFDPYLDTMGGGERYSLTVATTLKSMGYHTEIAWDNEDIFRQAQQRFGLDLLSISINPLAYSLLTKRVSLIKKYIYTSNYHLIFFVSDGSIPFLFAKKNLLHFQVPFHHLGGNRVINQLKLTLINKIVYNSKFTQNVIESQLNSNKGDVVYPPIDIDRFRSSTKNDSILSVARFNSPKQAHNKRQDILIEAFKVVYKKYPQYKLILAGGIGEDLRQIELLKKMSFGFPVEILTNPSIDRLAKLYSQARFFWHSAGYGIDEKASPEKVEHFGMATVEAMSAGCVPIVVAKGGQKEIINHGSNGFLAHNISEIALWTTKAIEDSKIVDRVSSQAIADSIKYSRSNFSDKFMLII